MTCPAGKLHRAVLSVDGETLKTEKGGQVLQALAHSSAHQSCLARMVSKLQPITNQVMGTTGGMYAVCTLLSSLVSLCLWSCSLGASYVGHHVSAQQKRSSHMHCYQACRRGRSWRPEQLCGLSGVCMLCSCGPTGRIMWCWSCWVSSD